MPFSRAGQLARSAPSARLSDPLALVAENLRASMHGVLPVFDRPTFGPDDPSELNARVIGLISQKDLSRATQRLLAPSGLNGTASTASSPALNGYAGIASNGFGVNGHNGHAANGHAHNPDPYAPPAPDVVASAEQVTQAPSLGGALAPEEAGASSQVQEQVKEEVAPPTLGPAWHEMTARDVMQRDVPYIPEAFSLVNALLMLDRHDLPALPVYDAAGRYRGLVSRADLISALYKGVRPPLVGGMATPLGVWLTDGRLTGGAPPFGLFLTGLTLAGFLAASQLILAFVATFFSPTWAALAFSGRLGIGVPDGPWLNFIFFAIQSLLFLAMFRLVPLSGIHAAEHQTVHALERGLPLEPEYVAKMPRAHPRCGTNLTVLLGLVTIGMTHLPSYDSFSIMLVLVFTFFAWRSFGSLVQEWFTTRPASRKQIESGIKAANELITQYQTQQFMRPPLALRLLNSGLIYVVGGSILGEYLWWNVLTPLLARLILHQ